MSTEFERLANELRDLLRAANEDIAECSRWLKSSGDSQFWRRVAYRTVFASIEALVSHLKQSAILFSFHDDEVFSPAEQLAMRDQDFEVDEKGRVVERNAKIRFLPNVCFAFRVFAVATAKDFQIVKDSGWDALTRAVKVRDRITHPKSAAAYTISDEEIKWMQDGWRWFGETLVAVSS